MDRTGESRRSGTGEPTPESGSAEESHPQPAIEPASWRELTEFRDQFSAERVFGIFADPADGPEAFWIVRDIEKVRPSAVPIDQPPTFEMNVLGVGGEIVDDLRLTIEEIEHVRVADPSDAPRSEESDDG